MKRLWERRDYRLPNRNPPWLLAVVLCLLGGASLQSQECLEVPLTGLPPVAAGGERILISVRLDSGCNYKVVEEASLVCTFPNGQTIEQRLTLLAGGDSTQGELVLVAPKVRVAQNGECFIRFIQCNRTFQTCVERLRVLPSQGEAPYLEPSQVPDPTGRTGRVQPPVRHPVPPSRPIPAPSPGRASSASDGSGAKVLRGLGWIGVTLGLAAHADAGSKEEEGKIEEAQKSENLGNQALAIGGAFLLLGYSFDKTSSAFDGESLLGKRFRPMLSVDPVNRGVFVGLSLSFD